MSNREINRAFAGFLIQRILGDEIVNYDEANRELEAVRNMPLILAHNHFGLPDGPHEVPNSFRFKSIREREVTLAVTHYLITYAQWLNNMFGLEMNLTAVVTPYIENRDQLKDKYAGRRGEGLLKFLKAAKDTLTVQRGVVEVNPQATRTRGGMGEPGEENKVMRGLLKITEKANPSVVPVGMWVEGKQPEEVYGIHLRGYKFKYGKPVSATEIKTRLMTEGVKDAENFAGADKLVYGLIKELLPENYR
jgi:hypothetical protein